MISKMKRKIGENESKIDVSLVSILKVFIELIQ